ncbi:MAG: sulfite exporter TauE/SafE family protein, partial [Candidatus Methanomethylophilaceae archaeon]|nr:sulfite exporter TauE/SafE family protein [Candidatus Methanomethylophilaceae archaeon]
MDPLIMAGLVVMGCGAGILGALFGLGGGIIFVPLLMLVFGLAPTEAVAVSLIGIIAGSVGASTVFVDKGLSNVRLGLLLEITTAAGAILGAIVATLLDDKVLMVIFSAIVIYSGIRMILNPEKIVEPAEDSEGKL